MQLPDHMFGRRWPLHFGIHVSTGETERGLILASLPERIVIWEIAFLSWSEGIMGCYMDLRLGDHEPATAAEFAAFESVFGSQITNDSYPGTFMANNVGAYRWTMRHPVQTMGRRFIVEIRNGHTVPANMSVVIVISSFPTEVPDCLVNSEYLRSQS